MDDKFRKLSLSMKQNIALVSKTESQLEVVELNFDPTTNYYDELVSSSRCFSNPETILMDREDQGLFNLKLNRSISYAYQKAIKNRR